MSRAGAILWLHLLRLWRYRYSFINFVLNSTLWVTIFLLGALMFVEPEKVVVGASLMFWSVTMWMILMDSTSLIGGWTNFYLSLGMVEEHMLVGVSNALVMAGRVIPGLSVSTAVILLVYYILSSLAGSGLMLAYDAAMLSLGLACYTATCISYGLILAAISLRTSIPPMLLDMSGFAIFMLGGIAAPLSMIPEPIRTISLIIPFSHLAEVVRYGATGYKTLLPLGLEAALAVLITAAAASTAAILMNRVERRIRVHGLKAVGKM